MSMDRSTLVGNFAMDKRTYVIPPISSQGEIVMQRRIFDSSIPYNRSSCNIFGHFLRRSYRTLQYVSISSC